MLLMQESSFRLPQVGVAFKSMAVSQVVTVDELQVLEINSYIRGYHTYADVWVPAVGETLLVKPEPVAVLKDTTIVGHVPQNLAPLTFSIFEEICQQSTCSDSRRKNEQRNKLRSRGAMHLPPVRPSSLY